MIKTEIVTIGKTKLVKTYSDESFIIACGLEKYEAAYDPVGSERVYDETERKISGAEVSADLALAEIKEVLEA